MNTRKEQKIIYALLVLAVIAIVGIVLYREWAARVVNASGDVREQIKATEAVGAPAETTEIAETIEITEITNLADAFTVILQSASKEYIAGYAVDETFLMWLSADCGEEAVIQLAWRILDGAMDENDWYDITGESLHVLWLRYCEETGFQSYQLENVIWTQCQSAKEIVVSFTGDFNFAEDWYTMKALNERENGIYDCITPDLLQIMQDSDVLFMNNEFVYSDSNAALPGKAYTFRANPERAELLKTLGADIVSLGNNHTYDFGEEGLLDTMEVLKQQGIAYVGAGENLKDAQRIVYFVANGKKIAFVAATEIERTIQYTKEATETSAGVLKTRRIQRFLDVIGEAAQTSDYVIAVPHWGSEGTLFADESQKSQAARYAEAGADVIIGGHPHRLQGVEFYGETPVAYSLGNFWFSEGTLYTTVAQVVIQDNGEPVLRFLPCEQKDLTTRLITDKTEKDEFYHYLAAISTDVGIDAEGNVYHKTEAGGEMEFPYDSSTSTTSVQGGVDNDGYAIDIVGNRY